MVASLIRRFPVAARFAVLTPLLIAHTTPVAHQDLASLLLQQPGVAERARSFLLSNSFDALKTATLSLPRPAGLAIPQLPILVHMDVTGSIGDGRDEDPVRPDVQVVNRGTKRDQLELAARVVPPVVETVVAASPESNEPDYVTVYGFSIPADAHLDVAEVEPVGTRADLAGALARAVDPVPAAGIIGRVSRLFFGASDLELPPLSFQHRPQPEPKVQLAALGPEPGTAPVAGSVTVAPKGLVTGEEGQPKSPAERLGLVGAKREKAHKCLADAIYFESRGEPERGQVAVAQVVINRVFSGFYPEDVCGTVYQNAHRYLACQFTFACEGKKLVVNDPEAWERATRIANEMLDGKAWLNEVGKATHYHAYWVKPGWIREMRKIHRIGVHTFYRPLAWEEG